MIDETPTKLVCRGCTETVELITGEDGVQATCDCETTPLMTRRGTLSQDWNPYTPPQEQ